MRTFCEQAVFKVGGSLEFFQVPNPGNMKKYEENMTKYEWITLPVYGPWDRKMSTSSPYLWARWRGGISERKDVKHVNFVLSCNFKYRLWPKHWAKRGDSDVHYKEDMIHGLYLLACRWNPWLHCSCSHLNNSSMPVITKYSIIFPFSENRCCLGLVSGTFALPFSPRTM